MFSRLEDGTFEEKALKFYKLGMSRQYVFRVLGCIVHGCSTTFGPIVSCSGLFLLFARFEMVNLEL